MGIFDERKHFKPFEYPELLDYVDAINNSYWLHTEWNFKSDVQDFNLLDESSKNVIKNTLLAISQIEVSVKTFWAKLFEVFPKAEFNAVGVTFAECEVRHERAYSHILEVLGLNHDFKTLLDIPEIRGRVDYLQKYLNKKGGGRKYVITLALFSMFIENTSLFSQFAIAKSFNKHSGILKDVDNVIQATQQEEQIHGLFGAYLVNLIKEEHPEWFDEEFKQILFDSCKKSYRAEVKIIDWILRGYKGDVVNKESLIEFLKLRYNESLNMIGYEDVFELDEEKLSKMQWFIEELKTETHTDFFNKKSTAYSKNMRSIDPTQLTFKRSEK